MLTTARRDDAERGGHAVGDVEEATFAALAERHRRELHVHRYRMLASGRSGSTC